MPIRADATIVPDAPSDVLINISQTRVHVTWDSPTDPDEGDTGVGDPDLSAETLYGSEQLPGPPEQHVGAAPIFQDEDDFTTTTVFTPEAEDLMDVSTDPDISYFQAQLATNATFKNIIRFDRKIQGHSKTWRVHRPGPDNYHTRVRSVDFLGNKSEWVSDLDSQAVVPAPEFVSMRFNRQPKSENMKAYVTVTNVVFADEDISRYQCQLREIEHTRLTSAVTSSDGILPVREFSADEVAMNPNTDEPDFNVWVEDEHMTVTSISGAEDKNWHVTRGINGTTARHHANGKLVWYFGASAKADSQMVTEEPSPSTETTAVFRNCSTGTRYMARARSIDAQNRRSLWSDWTGTKRAFDDASAEIGDPDDETEDPPVILVDYPFERIFRLITDISDTFESDVFTGLEGTVTAARAVVGTAPTSDVTVDVNLDGSSFLTLTIPADEVQSDLTFVVPPLFIGTQDGQAFDTTNDITVTQTDMQDSADGLTVYVLAYLLDGT